MRIGSRQFSPKLWAIALYVAVLSCMLWLGQWQLNRAALKVSFQESATQAQLASATPINTVSNLISAAAVYRRVLVEGTYDPTRQFLWDNRTKNGIAGFEVISPVKMPSGEWVLINRGWVAPGASRSQLPDIELPTIALEQSLSIEGLLSRPSKGFSSGDAVETSDGWPRILQFFDYESLSDILGGPVLPVVVQVQSVNGTGADVTVYQARPEWLEANWEPAASGPAKHYSYAFQWFAMALALSIIFIVVNTRKLNSPSTDSSE